MRSQSSGSVRIAAQCCRAKTAWSHGEDDRQCVAQRSKSDRLKLKLKGKTDGGGACRNLLQVCIFLLSVCFD